MRKFAFTTTTKCVVICAWAGRPTTGMDCFCTVHEVFESIATVHDYGYWMECGKCNVKIMYGTPGEARRRGLLHEHSPVFRIYEGTKGTMFRPPFYNDQDTLGGM